MKITVRIADHNGVMVSTGDASKYTEEELLRQLVHRRDQLAAKRVTREDLRVIGEDHTGVHYADFGDYYNVPKEGRPANDD